MDSTIASPPIRHVEARRTATCGFANRVASRSLSIFRKHVGYDRPTCVAAILVYDGTNLAVLSMGVGTKFLSSKHSLCAVRDMHAEVLCRRGLQRFLVNEMNTGQPSKVLRKDDETGMFYLQPNITLHLYCSSAPCGNSVVKKFATLKKDKYRDDCDDSWPIEAHSEVDRHSTHLGQCALLLKRNPIESNTAVTPNRPDPRLLLTRKQRSWPIYCSTDWCPPGTTASWDVQHGCIHTCSDKLARWNVLGWQGSLLSSKLVDPIRPVSMTVGRKFSSVTCRRAICCRIQNNPFHVSVMGDAVYMDETGAIDTSSGDDMRFHAKECWVAWKRSPFNESGNDDDDDDYITETLSTSTGMLVDSQESSVCTNRLMEDIGCERVSRVSELRELKQTISPDYESRKRQLLTQDPVFKDWNPREDLIE